MAKSSGSPAGFFVPNIKNFLTAATTSKSWLTFYGLSTKKIFGGVGGSLAGRCVGVIGDFYWTECKKRAPGIAAWRSNPAPRTPLRAGSNAPGNRLRTFIIAQMLAIVNPCGQKFFLGESRLPLAALALALTAQYNGRSQEVTQLTNAGYQVITGAKQDGNPAKLAPGSPEPPAGAAGTGGAQGRTYRQRAATESRTG